MFCTNCGFQLGEGVKFCTQCGTKLAVDPVQPVFAASPVQQAEAPIEQPEPVAEPMSAPMEEVALIAEPAPASIEQPEPVAEPVPAPMEEVAPIAEPVTAPIEQPTEYIYEDQPAAYKLNEPEAVAAKKRRPLAVRIIIPIVFGIFIFVLLMASTTLLGVRNTLETNALSDKVEQIQPLDIVVGDLIKSGKLGESINEQLYSYNITPDDIKYDTTLGELVVIFSEGNVSSRQLRNIIAEVNVMERLGDVVESYERYLLTNESQNILSKAKIKELIYDNIDEVSDICGASFSIDESLLDEALEDNESTINGINPQAALNGYGSLTSLALSYIVIFGTLGLAVVFAVLIGVICKSWYSPLLTFGICAFLSGGLFIALHLLVDTIVGMTGFDYAVVTSLAVPIVKETLLSQLFTIGIIAASAGALMIAAAVVINVLLKKAAYKKSAA